MLQIKLNNDGKFVVTKFEAEHTHDLVSRSSSHAMRSQRGIENAQAGLINQMHLAGFTPSQIFSYLTVEAGGPKNLNFLQTDCNNFIRRRRAEFLEKVVFDTTFKTNKYGMVCAPIVGVNHQGQTILFGYGLLDGETSEACKWFFNVFLEAMGGKKPKTIFTDQAASIASAIREVLPESHHHLCLWHIYQNAAKHLNPVFEKFSMFSQDFKRCIYNPESVEEFESSWKDLLDYYDLTENDWLKDLYELREKWAQIYGRSNFCAAKGAKDKQSSTLVESKLLELEAELDGNLPSQQEHEAIGDIYSDDDQVHENNANLVLRDPKVKKRKRHGKGKRNNDLGYKKKLKKRSSSAQHEQEDAPVPLINDLRSKKMPKRRSTSIRQEQEDTMVPPEEQCVSAPKKKSCT
ncbi:hypothetical protein ACLB2K_022658 [Fragaria x ananassa]